MKQQISNHHLKYDQENQHQQRNHQVECTSFTQIHHHQITHFPHSQITHLSYRLICNVPDSTLYACGTVFGYQRHVSALSNPGSA